MADLNAALIYLGQDEGAYVNDPRDPGGETYRGVARKRWPNWDGWKLIDAARSHPTFPKNLAANSDLQNLVNSFYRKNFWRFDGITSQDVANKVFDIGVNDGLTLGIKLLQKAVAFVSGVRNLAVDGQYGPQTEAAINGLNDQNSLLLEFRAQSALYYCRQNDQTFIHGWMRRAVR